MAVILQKGQKVDLTKGRAGLSNLIVGLGWDPVKNGGGLLRGLFGGSGGSSIDCDASVLMLDENGKLKNKKDIVYFMNKKSSCGGVHHSGDNLTGQGDGDDEQIFVNLNKISNSIHRVVFVVNIYACESRKQHFGMINNAYIRVVDDSKKEEIVHFKLTENYNERTSLVVGEIYRHNGEWKFNAIGEGTRDTSIEEIARRYQ